MTGCCFLTGISPALRRPQRDINPLKKQISFWHGTDIAAFTPGRRTGKSRAHLRISSSLSSPAECPDSTENKPGKRSLVLVTGKFDSFHLGHQALVKSAAGLGHPTLLSFSGMAEALNWPPRLPVVAPVERSRILREWGFQLSCSVGWRSLRFDDVQDMAPGQFLDYVKEELGATAVVCGTDWRFGSRAEGDVALLLRLSQDRDLRAVVVDPVLFEGSPISSTRVRTALQDGNVGLASELMGRPHRLVGYVSSMTKDSVSCMEFVNQVPGEGMYSALIRVIGAAQPVRSFVQVSSRSSASVDSGNDQIDTEKFQLPLVTIYDATQIYCDDCEVYIDFIDRVK